MIFLVDADLLYSRRCKARLGWQRQVANEDLLIHHPEPKEIELPDKYVADMLNFVERPCQLFDWHFLGWETAGVYKENLGGHMWHKVEMGKYIQPQIIGYLWNDVCDEDLWQEEKLRAMYESEDTVDFDCMINYPDGKPSYERFKAEQIKGKSQIVHHWLSTEVSRIPEPRYKSIEHHGGWASGVWYPDDFEFEGAINIRQISLVDEKKGNRSLVVLHDNQTLVNYGFDIKDYKGEITKDDLHLDTTDSSIISNEELKLPSKSLIFDTDPKEIDDTNSLIVKMAISVGVIFILGYFLM